MEDEFDASKESSKMLKGDMQCNKVDTIEDKSDYNWDPIIIVGTLFLQYGQTKYL